MRLISVAITRLYRPEYVLRYTHSLKINQSETKFNLLKSVVAHRGYIFTLSFLVPRSIRIDILLTERITRSYIVYIVYSVVFIPKYYD